MGTYIIQLLRQICFFLDNIVYSLIEKCFQLIMYLANIDFMGLTGVQEIVNRIYLLLGIFMLFKVSFSFLQYLIDPASFSDSSKGFGKLLTNTIVALALLVATPFIFDKLYEFQAIIIKSNAISNLVLGNALIDEAGNKHTSSIDQTETIAKDIQFAMFGAFYTINYDPSTGLEKCAPTDEYPNANVFGSRDMVTACLDDIVSEMENELQRNGGGTLEDLFKYIDNGQVVDNRDFAILANLLWWKKGGSDTVFVINYLPLVSTLTGGYLLLLLITFCIDIAARAVKLMFLQMVAPISIISYVDPKESISNGKLNGWIKEVAKTYFSLFLRLAVIFLAVSLVSILVSALFSAINASNDIYQDPNLKPETGSGLNMFVFIFLVLGVFTFAKQVPALVESVFGIKMSGEMSLNPFKSIRENLGATALIGGVAGFGASAAAATKNAYEMNRGKGALGLARGIRQTAFGTLSGAAGGMIAGARTGGKGGYVAAGVSQGGRVAWNQKRRENTTFPSRFRDRFSRVTGGPRDAFLNKQKTDAYEETKKTYEGIQSKIVSHATSRANDMTLTAAQRANANHMVEAERAYKLAEKQYNEGAMNKADYEVLKDNYEGWLQSYSNSDMTTAERQSMFEQINRQNREHSNYDGYTGSEITEFNDAKALAASTGKADRELKSSHNFEDGNQFETIDKRQSEMGFRDRNNQRRG